jgi:hypothetical protein
MSSDVKCAWAMPLLSLPMKKPFASTFVLGQQVRPRPLVTGVMESDVIKFRRLSGGGCAGLPGLPARACLLAQFE